MNRFFLFALAALVLPGLAFGQSVDLTKGPGDKPGDKSGDGEKATGEPEWKVVKTGYQPTPADEFPFVTPALKSKPITGMIPLPSPIGFVATVDGTKLNIDVNADQQPDLVAKGATNELDLVLQYVDGTKAPYRIQANRSGKSWAFYRACYRQGTFKGQRIVLIDDDADGKYNATGSDAMVVGASKYAAYVSDTIMIGGQAYECQINEAGTEIKLRERQVDTGKVDITREFQAKGKLEAAVLQAGTQSYEVAKGATIPVGTYTLVWGVIAAGSKSAQLKSQIAVTVEKDKVATAKFGAPFKMDFFATRKGTEVTVSSQGIRVFGCASEEYYGFSKASLPNIIIRDKNTQKVVSKGKMGTAWWGTPTSYTGGVPDTFSPVEVQVTSNQWQDLLGPIESSWKQY